MCGIFGEIGPGGDRRALERFGQAGAHALRHRGPDGRGVWLEDAHCVLGHTRLAILDLSPAGAQPMRASSGRTVLTFNGEIYNYLELRSRLAAPPGGWRSHGDTEVLVELLDREGVGCLSSLVGMFALAVWRPDQRELWLVRDRLGKKPLYYARTRQGRFRFGSELAALLADDAVPRSTTPDRIAEFLQHGYVAAPRTGLAEVQAVPPGSWLRARLRGGDVEVELARYWDLPEPDEPATDRLAWEEEFHATLRDAVRIRLRSDVPVGAFLSGGIDSSVVSLLAAELAGVRLRTFTVDFGGDGPSEGPFGAEVARRLGVDHQVLRVDARAAVGLEDHVARYGDLHGDASAIPTAALCREVRRHVTVALSGDGGDELLGGYGRYHDAIRRVGRVARAPGPAIACARLVAAAMPWWMRGATRLGRLSNDLATYYTTGFWSYGPQRWPPVLCNELASGWPDDVARLLRENAGRPPLLRLMATDMRAYLPEDILVKTDRASMAVGLEVRSPLLDHRLCELVLRAHPSWLADPKGAKLPLRRAYAGRLPGGVFSRPKVGFGPPLKEWLRGEMTERARDRLLSPASDIAPLLDRRAVGRMLASHEAGQRDEAYRIWRLLVADAWLAHWRPSIATDAPRAPGRAEVPVPGGRILGHG